MKKKENQHIGSSFDKLLKEEGILRHAQMVAAKRIDVFLFQQKMKKQKLLIGSSS